MHRIERLSMCTGLAAATAGLLLWGAPAQAETGPETDATPPVRLVNEALGLSHSTVLNLNVQADVGDAFSVTLPLDGRMRRINLVPHSVRTDDYVVFEQLADGTLRRAPATPVNTLRGHVVGQGDSLVAGSLLEDGLHLLIQDNNGREHWLEPLSQLLDGADLDDYVLYSNEDVMPHAGRCGMIDAVRAKPELPAPEGLGGIAGDPCIAEFAADADFEYFQIFGSVAATQNRINSITNTVNIQYENQVGITHQIGTIIVRSNANDPYTSSDSTTLLCQFITEWSNNQQGIQRDVAALFTGRDLNGGVIGQAADIGNTGICVSQGGCNGGQFGTFGSYCINQTEFNGNFSCATDLLAHELGHLWGAFHCNCPGNTMNPSITCANNFSGGTIASISAYAATRTCLDGPCGGGGSDDDCTDREPIFNGDTQYSTLGATTDGPAVSGNGSPEEGDCNDFGDPQIHNDIWFNYTADFNGTLTLSTCDQVDYDSKIAVYDGCTCPVTNPRLIGCNDDGPGCGGFTSQLDVTVSNGTCYKIRVGGFGSDDAGSGTLSLTKTPVGDPTGACCIGNQCFIQTEADCVANGGKYQGDNTNCAGDPCNPPDPTGGCCIDNECFVLSQSQCEAAGGDYLGDDTDCAGDPCAPDPTGACCVNNSCIEVTEAECVSFGGKYFGDNTTCDPDPCAPPDPTGGCCINNECFVLTQSECAAAGGDYLGDDTDCSGDPCAPPPTGGCCVNNTCVILSQADCENAGGDYLGDNTDCANDPCAKPVDNDDCSGRVAIANGDTTYTTVGATTDGPPVNGDGSPEEGDCNDFGDPQIHNDVWFNYTADFDGILRVSTCDQVDYDSKLAVYEGCACPVTNASLVGCNDDGPGCGGFTSQLDINVTNGQCYKIRVGGFGEDDSGTGVLTLTKTPLGCDIDCVDNEGEPCGDDNNGGCNSDPVEFGSIECGTPVCGNAWADAGSRDTDWYLIDVPDPDGDGQSQICATLFSEFPGVCFIVGGIDTCQPAVLGDIGCASDCENIQVASACVPAPAQYVVFVAAGNCDGSGVFEGFPCGTDNDYTVEVSVTNCGEECGGCPDKGDPCPWDLNNDGDVGPADLANVLDNWGENPGHPADFNGNGVVGPEDLAKLLDNWGSCP